MDIPYAAAKLEQATADAAGNLVFSGEIGFYPEEYLEIIRLYLGH